MKILLTGGGTAGHVMPHIAMMDDFRKNYHKIIYIGSKNGIERDIIANQKDVLYYPITTTKFIRKKILKNLLIPFKLIKAIKEAKKIIKEENPNVIFSKGGFVSLPVVYAAKRLKVPVVAHESDLNMGLANKLSKPSATVICTTFKKTADEIQKKGIYTGSPMRLDLLNKNKITSKEKLGIKTSKPILVITGGSQGSKRINEKIRYDLKALTKIFYVIHLTGKGNIDEKLKKYPDYMQIEFTEDMGTILSCSDIVVSRAGSNTIFELATLQKPMLLIPLPKGNSRGDQVDNAKYFNNQGFANFVTEEQLQTSSIYNHIIQTLKESKKLTENLKKANIQPGNKKLLEIIKNNTKK